MMRAFRLIGAAFFAAATFVACYDFEQDYENCKAFGRCAQTLDDAGTGSDSGVVGGDAGSDAGVDAGPTYGWTHVRTLPGHVRIWGLWAMEPEHVMFVGAYPGTGGLAAMSELRGGQWIDNPYAIYVSPFPAVASTNGLTCALGEWSGWARTHTFPNGSWDGGQLGNSFSHDDGYYALWPAGDAFFIGSEVGNISYRTATTWVDAGTITPATDIQDGWASAPNNQFIVTADRRLLHFDGGGWTTIATRPVFNSSVWGVSPDEVWIAGQEVVRLRQGSFQSFDAGPHLWNGLWGSGPDDVYLTGNGGWLAHWDGASFKRTQLSPNNLASVHGTGPNDVWVTDIDGGIWHYGLLP